MIKSIPGFLLRAFARTSLAGMTFLPGRIFIIGGIGLIMKDYLKNR